MNVKTKPTDKRALEDFLAQKTLAVVGVSRDRRKMGHAIFLDLKARGFRVFPVNPNAEKVGDERCYASLRLLPAPVDGALVVCPRAETERVVRDAAAAGIRRVWLQRGADTLAAVRLAEAAGLSVVAGECILMYAEPVGSVHRVHRFFRRLLGRGPR